MLKTDRVSLSPIVQSELPRLFSWINDRDLVLLNAPYKPITEGEHAAWFESVENRDDIVIFGISVLETGKLIGTCQLHTINYIHRSAELQIRIGEREERGKGYGTEATRLLLDFAFKDLNLHRVHLHVLANNEAARRMYKKLGFVEEGILRKAGHIDGVYVDIVVMGILRDEYGG